MQTKIIDDGLLSIEQTRLLSKSVKPAYRIFAKFSQGHIAKIVDSMAKKAIEHAQRLARLAVVEKRYTNVKD